MDLGDWFFLGMVVISGVASLSKAGKKKASAQTSEQSTSTAQEKSDADEWIKKIIRETSKGLLDEDEFIPKKETRPSAEPTKKPRPTLSNESSIPTLEQYRRTNQSLENTARPRVSLENTTVVEGKVNHTGVKASAFAANDETVSEKARLNPADDFKDVDEVRKAIIYGEILRTKF